MKTHVEELTDNRVRLDVEVPPEDVNHAFDHALSDLARSVRIPGFRTGKAPKRLVMQRLGRETVVEEALRDHIGGWYTRAVAVAGIDPVDRPTIDWSDEPSEDTSFTFTAEVAVKPRPEVGEWRGLEAARPPADVPADAVDEEIERLRRSVGELRPAERPAQADDFVVIDYAGAIDGTPFDGGSGRDLGVEVGSGQLLPDLEKGLEGMTAGETREIAVRFPDEYPAPHLAGKEAVFTVTMKDVKERVLPERDDEFAKSASEFDTYAELRDDIERRMREALESRADMQFRGAVLQELAGKLTTPLPESLVTDRMSEMARDMMGTLQARGHTIDDYLRATGQSGQQVVDAMRPHAEDAVRKDLVLEAVADAEAVEVEDERIEAWVREQALARGEDGDEAVARLMADPAVLTALRRDLRLQRALDLVVDAAKPITPEAAEARSKLWTPEKESAGRPGTPTIWTPGSGEPADR